LIVVAACADLPLDPNPVETETPTDSLAADSPAADVAVEADPTRQIETEVGPGLDTTDILAVVRFDLTTDGFFDTPWPHDIRRLANGNPDFATFPNSNHVMIDRFTTTLEENVSGYSAMPVNYVLLDPAPDDLVVPTPRETLESSSPVQLLELGDGCGARIPMRIGYTSDGDLYRPKGLLSTTPVVGFPLSPNTTYALLVTRELGQDEGLGLGPDAEMVALIERTHDDAELGAMYEPLWQCLSDEQIAAGSLAAASVFTTGDPVAEVRTIVDTVSDPNQTLGPQVTDWAEREIGDDRNDVSYTGWYQTPIYQAGEPPYESEGGFVIDGSGLPVVQRWESVPFIITWPAEGEGPFPVLIWIDGTGARLTGHVRDDTTQAALEAGFAVAAFSPQFHGPRAVPDSDPVLHSFNYLNPESGRTVFRQQAVDTSYFVRVLQEAVGDLPNLPKLDTDHLVYGGHSQGGLVGALVAALEEDIDAFFLNGTGSYVSETVLERKDPFDIEQMVIDLLAVEGELDVMHPVIAVIQMGSDTVDSYNYAGYWRGWDGHESGSHVFMSNGQNDHTTPSALIDHLTVAADLAPISPAGWDVDPYDLWWRSEEATPIQGNRVALDGSALTSASYLNSETGHFTVQRDDQALEFAVSFWVSALTGVPTIE